MRVRHEERGAIAVIFAIMLIVLIATIALTIDGGLLYTKHRGLRNANDAAALAAALSCARRDGELAANEQADLIAASNVGDATLLQPNVYTPACDAPAGKVTVQYGGTQSLMFAPAIGIDSPHPVAATATAVWGAAGGAARIAPLMVTTETVLRCEEQEIGAHCFFWWNPDELSSAEWGLMNLDSWGNIYSPTDSCAGYQSTNQALVTEWIRLGFDGTLVLTDPGPTWVCRGPGSQGGALNNDINFVEGEILFFPVNDPTQQVGIEGSSWAIPCLPDTTCTVDKYAIVGLSAFQVVHAVSGGAAATLCNKPMPHGAGDVRCLEVIWQGPIEDGVIPGGGHDFGLIAVGLSE